MTGIQVVVSSPVQVAESPIWDDRRSCLWWIDVFAGTVHQLDPATCKDTAMPVGARVGAVALRADDDLLLAAGRGFATYEVAAGQLRWLGTVEHGNWMNDGACDPAGRFLAGTMVDERESGNAALYRLEHDTASPLLTNVTISNGLGWSPDGRTLYYVDTPLERIDAFDYTVETGALSRRRVFADLHDVPGRPDGLTVDADGGVWVAMARSGMAVRRFTPAGQLDYLLTMPVPNITSVAFGGPALDELYITTSQYRLTATEHAAYPLSGCVFRVPDIGLCGLPAHRYQG